MRIRSRAVPGVRKVLLVEDEAAAGAAPHVDGANLRWLMAGSCSRARSGRARAPTCPRRPCLAARSGRCARVCASTPAGGCRARAASSTHDAVKRGAAPGVGDRDRSTRPPAPARSPSRRRRSSRSRPSQCRRSSKTSGTRPQLMRLARWIRANDLAMTARTPRCMGPMDRRLARRALAVRLAAHDDAAPGRLGAGHELRRRRSGSRTRRWPGRSSGRRAPREPEGEMSSVETLSPSLRSTGASRRLGHRLAERHRLDVRTAHDLARAVGRDEADRRGREAGRQRRPPAGAPSVRGSVMTPVSAEAAATTDEQR